MEATKELVSARAKELLATGVAPDDLAAILGQEFGIEVNIQVVDGDKDMAMPCTSKADLRRRFQELPDEGE